MGLSIAFEGGEGVGKTTQVRIITYVLDKVLGLPVLSLREPGGTLLGEGIRQLLRTDEFKRMHPLSALYLYSASRAELIFNKILPWLETNKNGFALADRCWWSTVSLQGEDGVPLDLVRATQQPFVNVWPNKFIFTDLHPLEAKLRIARSKFMGQREIWWRDDVPLETFQRIRRRYLELVDIHHKNTLLLDGFEDPATRAFKALTFILGREPFELNEENKEMLLQRWESITGFTYEELMEAEKKVRLELDMPDKEALHVEMVNEWKLRMLVSEEGQVNGLERE